MPKVREAIRMVRRDGWYHVRTRGSHRHYKHPRKSGKVTIAGHPGQDLSKEMYDSILKQGRAEIEEIRMEYVVTLERVPNNYGASVPDLPGCVAAADTREETLELIREGIGYHIELMLEDGDPVPQPRMSLKDAMADYLSMGDVGYRDPDTGEWVEYEFQTLEVAFLMVEVNVDLTAARAVSNAEPAVAATV